MSAAIPSAMAMAKIATMIGSRLATSAPKTITSTISATTMPMVSPFCRS
jgi:hypothetical protein